MKALVVITLVSSVIALGVSNKASALAILEVEGNDTLTSAQNLDGFFSTGSNPDIKYSDVGASWVSISATGDGTFDYFVFTHTAPGQIVYDIDYNFTGVPGSDAPLVLSEYFLAERFGSIESVSQCLVGITVCGGQTSGVADPSGGSYAPGDPFVEYSNFNTNNVIIIAVAKRKVPGPLADTFPHSGIWSGGGIPDGMTYTLQVSMTGGTSPAPEPSTLFLLGTGLVGLVGYARRKKG